MKKVLSFLFISVGISAFAQQQTDGILTKAWTLKSDIMTGIGKHTSLPKETQIEFLNDGTWRSSALWQNVRKGKWRLHDQKLLISFSPDDEDEFRVVSLTNDRLRLETNTITAVYKLAFETQN
ncbi:MAG TPA: hypothetical protein VL728_03270 [Cyclobacteriaceae bacterium]|jgi:hypothetical protein|nr:hypothetical protein [Cyclobacteriaceae bacterium]